MSSILNLTSRNQLRKAISPLITSQSRNKHSARQVNRLFNKNAARRRILKRVNGDKVEEGIVIPEPKFPPVYSPAAGILPNGWSEPPSSEDFVMPSYPFHIERTKNKPNGAVGFLPVYSDIRIGGTKKTTIIRKVTGDRDTFVSEMGIALGLTENELKDVVRVRTGGNIEIKGLHMNKVRQWLIGLGF